MKLCDKYKNGFIVNFEDPIFTENWLFSKELSSKDKLVFLGYDANLFPLPDFIGRPKNKYTDKVIEIALELTKEFNGEVWLEDVQIKEKVE